MNACCGSIILWYKQKKEKNMKQKWGPPSTSGNLHGSRFMPYLLHCFVCDCFDARYIQKDDITIKNNKVQKERAGES